jgi:pyrroline-5-carboxylate reductase
MNILVIGGGNMGKTFAQSFLNAHIIRKDQLHILEKDALKVAELNSLDLGVAYHQPGEYIRTSDIIILAVKPQDINVLYPVLKPFMREDQIVLSIMAGIRINDIKQQSGAARVVRAMPNLPCQVGGGVTAYFASKEVPDKDIAFIQLLLETTGLALRLDEEAKLDAVTAISGSGPAYVFYFMEAMIRAAMQMGFDRPAATQLTAQTFAGSVELFLANDSSCMEWIKRVSSKGGTTEAALEIFDRQDISNSIGKGLLRAEQRAKELSGRS